MLKSCGCRDDVDNLVGDVLRKALELSRKDPDPPRTVDRWKAIVRDVAHKTGLDDRKKARVRERAHGEKVTEHETVAASVAPSQRDDGLPASPAADDRRDLRTGTRDVGEAWGVPAEEVEVARGITRSASEDHQV